MAAFPQMNGETMTMPDGTKLVMGPNGQWVKASSVPAQPAQYGMDFQDNPALDMTPPVVGKSGQPVQPSILPKAKAKVGATSIGGKNPDDGAVFADADTKTEKQPRSEEYWKKAEEYQKQLMDEMRRPSDYSGYERVAREKGNAAGFNLAAGLGMMNAGEDFQPAGQTMLTKALGQAGPQEFDQGYVDASGKFIEKPGLERERQRKVLEKSLDWASQGAARVGALEEKAAERRQRALDREEDRKFRERQLALQMYQAEEAGWKTVKDENGRETLVNPRTGQSFAIPSTGTSVDDLPKTAPMEARKRYLESNLAMAQAEKLKSTLDKLPDADKRDFGGIVPAVQQGLSAMTSGAIPPTSGSGPKKDAQVALMRDAAMTINQLYGAALSKIEAGRAGQFTIQPGDRYDQIMRKLNAAYDYATNEKNTLRQQYGGKAPAAAGAPRVVDYNSLPK